jgi:inner membrane transporter RhtA
VSTNKLVPALPRTSRASSAGPPRARSAARALAADTWALAVATPPSGLALLAILSVQCGSALAKDLFHQLGPGGAVYLRILFGALILYAVRRPRLRGHTRAEYLAALSFGVAIAAMNASFYAAIDRIPLGVAVTLEFVGPLAVAVAGTRHKLDLLWSALACLGILLLAPWGGTAIDPLGVLMALVAGAGWAAYILLNVRVGRAFAGDSGLVLALLIAAVVALPLGLGTLQPLRAQPDLLLVALAVAILSTVVPFSLEHAALKRLPAQVFGILMSIEPAVAALIGLLLLHQAVTPRALAAMVAVTLASLGSARLNRPSPP